MNTSLLTHKKRQELLENDWVDFEDEEDSNANITGDEEDSTA